MTGNRARLVERLSRRDGSLWPSSDDPPLGWLDAAGFMDRHARSLMQWADSLIRDRRIRRVVLIGMGGSSLAAEVLFSVFGRQDGFPELVVADSTSPALVEALKIDSRTLFIVSSKSGSTVETADLCAWLYSRAGHLDGHPGSRFIAITDPGSGLAARAEADGFLRVFLNPPDIVGRFSALSLFGLVPAALTGIDLVRLGKRTESWWRVCLAEQPSVLSRLIGVMAECSRSGHGMLAVELQPPLRSLFNWIEQLVAESTGKKGRGILPVDPALVDGRAMEAGGCGIVRIGMDSKAEPGDHVVDREGRLCISMRDEYDLGGMFMLWQAATAVVASRLGVNAFDQPDVEAAKAEARRVVRNDMVRNDQRRIRVGQLDFYRSSVWKDRPMPVSPEDVMSEFCEKAQPGGYLAILAYMPMQRQVEKSLEKLADGFKSRFGAVTIGFGPRYLHSTGQLHKGGPPIGCFLQIVEDDVPDLVVPGRDYGFGRLHRAQADGDFLVLENSRRPIMRVGIRGDRLDALDRLADMLT
ncbi:MAG: hypothetical protein F4Z15_09565 [Gammaproteobacteria bacterium]|nr:hypothetical protein [Gammaproteobacteria bacterium]MYD76101.1 hypothetical protein [Gammaproteobacteria bacterium]MYJ51268.1 hypothetical protein [Gammaproteobacteria bacterium]